LHGRCKFGENLASSLKDIVLTNFQYKKAKLYATVLYISGKSEIETRDLHGDGMGTAGSAGMEVTVAGFPRGSMETNVAGLPRGWKDILRDSRGSCI